MPVEISFPNEAFRGGEQFNNFVMPCPHMHDNYELAMYPEHALHIINDSFEVTAAAPVLVLHRPYTLHRMVPADSNDPGPYRRYVFNCSKSFLNGIDPSYADIDRVFCEDVRVFRLNDAQLERLLPMVRLLSQRRDDRRQCRFLFCALLCEIERLDCTVPLSSAGKTVAYISSVVRTITDHYAEDLTTAALAEMHFTSVPKLNRDFRRYTHTTVHEMLLRVRMQKAAEFLAAGVSVSDTAYKCGFVNESHFIRTFRKLYQTTPYRYAKMLNDEK